MPLTIRLDLSHRTALGEIMGEIRSWLDRERIEATGFKSTEAPNSIGIAVTFATEADAERFRQRFVG
jgi:hypothetical protein